MCCVCSLGFCHAPIVLYIPSIPVKYYSTRHEQLEMQRLCAACVSTSVMQQSSDSGQACQAGVDAAGILRRVGDMSNAAQARSPKSASVGMQAFDTLSEDYMMQSSCKSTLMKCSKSPPEQSSVTIHTLSLSWRIRKRVRQTMIETISCKSIAAELL